MRKFEVVKGILEEDIVLPYRKTRNSAGYDVFALEDTVIEAKDRVLVRTGVKANFFDDEFLMLVNRSSGPKKGLYLANGIGIIDSDYYGCDANDGELLFQFINVSDNQVIINKGDGIGQAIFMKYLLTDDDTASGDRMGGFGSTDK